MQREQAASILRAHPDTLTAWEIIDARAEATPDGLLAVDERGRRLHFGAYRDTCLRIAAGLAGRGIGRDTRVAWILPTGIEAFLLAGALARLGATQVPLLPILREREVGFIIGQTKATHLVCPSVWRGHDYATMVRRASPTVDLVVHVVDPDLPEADPSMLDVTAPRSPDGERWIFYTSGTTANPKGARHTDRSVAACAHRMNLRFDATAEDRNGLVFPVTHVGGIAFLLGGLIAGYRHILVEVFDPVTTSVLLGREGVTLAGAGPVFWMTYVDQQRQHPERRIFPQLRALLGGGAPKSPTIHDEVRDVLGVVLATGYGLTECPTAAHSSVHDPDHVLRSDGRALDDTEIRIVRIDETPAAPNEVGEIRVRGPMMFQGYVDPADDADAFDADGFHRTGDLGRLDEDGVLTVTGRVKDIIIRKGENISAKEVEDFLFLHPAIADAAVVALPDRDRGELACAVVVVAADHGEVTLADIEAHCLALGLSRRKVPERLEVLPVLPRNPTGKVLKHVLQARYTTS